MIIWFGFTFVKLNFSHSRTLTICASLCGILLNFAGGRWELILLFTQENGLFLVKGCWFLLHSYNLTSHQMTFIKQKRYPLYTIWHSSTSSIIFIIYQKLKSKSYCMYAHFQYVLVYKWSTKKNHFGEHCWRSHLVIRDTILTAALPSFSPF